MLNENTIKNRKRESIWNYYYGRLGTQIAICSALSIPNAKKPLANLVLTVSPAQVEN